jgi:predicted RNase H-like HicB family nuclease
LTLDAGNKGPYGGSPKKSTRLWYPDYSLDYNNRMITLSVELEQEDDGRWIAEVTELPGVLAYGDNPEDARAKAQALALRVFADRLEHGEAGPDLLSISFKAA